MGNAVRYGIEDKVLRKLELMMSADVPELDLAFGTAHSAAASATKTAAIAPTVEIK